MLKNHYRQKILQFVVLNMLQYYRFSVHVHFNVPVIIKTVLKRHFYFQYEITVFSLLILINIISIPFSWKSFKFKLIAVDKLLFCLSKFLLD